MKVNSRWDKIIADQDEIGLLLVTHDIPCKQDENMQRTMEYVEEFIAFATTYQEPKQSNTDYYALFKSRQDMVMAHGGHTGYHLKLYEKHWKILMVTEGIIDK